MQDLKNELEIKLNQIFENLLNKIKEEDKIFIETKLNNFINYLKSIVNDEYKEKLSNELENMKKNKIEAIKFIMKFNEKNKDKHINEFIQKYNIDEKHKNKLNDYFDMIIGIKDSFNKNFNTKK